MNQTNIAHIVIYYTDGLHFVVVHSLEHLIHTLLCFALHYFILLFEHLQLVNIEWFFKKLNQFVIFVQLIVLNNMQQNVFMRKSANYQIRFGIKYIHLIAVDLCHQFTTFYQQLFFIDKQNITDTRIVHELVNSDCLQITQQLVLLTLLYHFICFIASILFQFLLFFFIIDLVLFIFLDYF